MTDMVIPLPTKEEAKRALRQLNPASTGRWTVLAFASDGRPVCRGYLCHHGKKVVVVYNNFDVQTCTLVLKANFIPRREMDLYRELTDLELLAHGIER